ncbi:alpha/beta-hydrolase [Cylindrobasidium torrendii FP15055 ss-10]|uniref:Alpha/beta-hydrolase n=1 Tax=Cylindrobasidium torrendii FP15055 ss-10 TaxID=1314674 RepID=A0A0D7BKP7_9AGAR|nr:alpha/beta-hydrolase [Cylindrobasidium torrendii FP15055 ss-10]
MPVASVDTSAGHADFAYTISTPTEATARVIDESLPTVLFLHGLFGDGTLFHGQFSDPSVRRFNCVVLDLRDHGKTKNDKIPKGYGPQQAGEDISAFMDAAALPPCHVLAAGFGTIFAVALAVLHPEKVKSLTLLSTIAHAEPEFVIDGRREIAVIWKSAYEHNPPDDTALRDAVFGARQLGFNKTPSLLSALTSHSLPICFETWHPERFDSYEHITLDFLADFKGWTDEELRRIKCPVQLGQGADDIAYSTEYITSFKDQLTAAGVDVRLEIVPGAPNSLWVTHSKEVNEMFTSFVKEVDGDLPAAPKKVVSPWKELLASHGLVPSDEEEEL